MTDTKPTPAPKGTAAKPPAQAPMTALDAALIASPEEDRDEAAALLEQMARAICQEKGTDPDAYFFGTLNWQHALPDAVIFLRLFTMAVEHTLEKA